MSGGSSSHTTGKRPLQEDDDNSTNNPPAKRVRFPKGKKGKPVDAIVEKVIVEEENVNDLSNPIVAAKERVKRRNQITAELLSEEHGVISNNISAAEVKYQANENFVEDGIHIEPFNLDKEREEGYFDASGNFVEYVRDNEIKDAWLDNVEIDPRFAGLSSATTKDEEEVQELSSKDVAIMKRRIANVLEPEETVLQCLRRLKGSGDRKAKMSGDTKIVFDQLTEDAMKLMENGEYDVYHEKKDVFEREAEGYEELARARGEGTSSPLASADDFDMFADDDAAAKPSTNENNAVSEPSSDAINSGTEGGALQSDYVYDESSGYYYSSSLGYYYDPNTGLYCSAESGKWYSFNEEAGTYDEVSEVSTDSI